MLTPASAALRRATAEHLLGHVEPEHPTLGSHLAGRDRHIRAGPAAEVSTQRTAVSSGCQLHRPRNQEHNFKAGPGRDFGVERHSIDSCFQSIAAEDEHRFIKELTKRNAMRAIGPVMVATPAALGMLTSQVASRAAEEAGSEPTPADLRGLLVTPWGAPDPVRAIRDGHRIAHEVLREEAAAEVFRTTSPMIALHQVREELPELDDGIRNHVEEYGWLRAAGYRIPPLTAETVVYRIQLALVRWPADAIESAARPTPVPGLEETHGVAATFPG